MTNQTKKGKINNTNQYPMNPFKKLDLLQKKIGHQFKDISLLEEALTHRSTLNLPRIEKSYERLEYLGDAVLESLISSYLFKVHPDRNEGFLTSARSVVVRTQSLAEFAQKIGLDQYIFMSRGEKNGGGQENPSTLEDVTESLIGAIYIDGGIKASQKFFNKVFVPHVKETLSHNPLKDSKSLLQEKVQSQKLSGPTYQIIKEMGPDHKKTFTVAVDIDDKQIATGKGKNKQEAEQKAAKKALKLI